jgi:hypothetical protein
MNAPELDFSAPCQNLTLGQADGAQEEARISPP